MADQLTFDFNAPLPTLPQLWTPDDIFTSLDQESVSRFKEDNRLERKRATINQAALSEYLSMWANTLPFGGIILVGVENDGTISGCNYIEIEHLNSIDTVRRLCADAKFETKRVLVKNKNDDDDFIIAIRVYYREDKLVETSDGKAFIREGDQKRLLTETEKREIRLSKGELDVESEKIPLKFPNDFDVDLLKEFRDEYITKRKLKEQFSIQDILKLSKLGKDGKSGFEPNLGCALVFAKDPTIVVPGAYIRVMRYEGTEEKFGRNLNSIASGMFSGPLPRQILAAEEFIASQIRNFTRLGRDGRFATNPEYPRDVWREAIINAVIHRSYNLKHMNIFVKLFDDKMVVESPGAFMPPTTGETVYEAHNPRNPNTMWALYYFDFVQCAFEGTRRMRSDMRKANLPDPKFVQKQIGTFQVSVTLENDQEHRKIYVRSEVAAAINPTLYESLSESEKLIVNYLADQPRVNVTDAGLVIAKDWRETKKILNLLEEKKIIERSAGKTRSRHRFYFLRRKVALQGTASIHSTVGLTPSVE